MVMDVVVPPRCFRTRHPPRMLLSYPPGGVAERPKAMVLKTIGVQAPAGSNPAPSAPSTAPGRLRDTRRMERRDINPWEWSKAFGFSQAVEVSAPSRVLRCSGQTAINDDGSPPATEDMGEQVRIAMDNLKTVLDAAEMTLANVIHLTVYTTDVDAFIEAHMADNRLGAAGVLPAMTLIGVARLAYPQLKVELEATAVA